MSRGPLFFVSFLLVVTACKSSNRSSAPNANELAASAPVSSPAEPELGAWMKANATPAMGNKDAAALERVFARMITLAPAGYADWESFASRGEAAARAGDLESCRATCKTCHEAHRARYKAERRAKSTASKNQDRGAGGS